MLGPSTTEWILIDLQGKELGHWPLGSGSVLWAPDGRSWLTVDRSGRAQLFGVRQRQATVFNHQPIGAIPIWFDGRGHVGYEMSDNNDAERVSIIDLDPVSHGAARRVELPPATESVYDAKVSPQGDRLAWYIGRRAERPAWVDKLLTVFHIGGASVRVRVGQSPPPIDTEGIWVSKLDSTDMREVGEVKAEWAPVGMGSFTWCPDGRHVLVTYRNGIYVVPVDP